MSGDAVAIIGFVALFVLMLLRVPVGMAMGLVGVAGFAYLVGGGPALKNVGHTTARTVTDYNFAVIPLFLLMGSFATTSGMSRELFRAANAFVGHLRGGLGIATIAACGGFAAICGSSVATAATFSRVAYPEMRRYGYPQSFATGVIAAGGTLGIMIPPSTVFAVYGLITEQDVGKLFIAGVIPGPARDLDVHDHDHAHRRGAARLSAGGPAQLLEGARSPRCATSGRRCCCSPSSSAGSTAACSPRPKRPAPAPAARSSSASRAGGCRAPTSCARCWRPPAPPPRCSRC